MNNDCGVAGVQYNSGLTVTVDPEDSIRPTKRTDGLDGVLLLSSVKLSEPSGNAEEPATSFGGEADGGVFARESPSPSGVFPGPLWESSRVGASGRAEEIELSPGLQAFVAKMRTKQQKNQPCIGRL